ncbi:MAG: hypothetical protein VYC17_06745 [Nitrospinota bacterium]|nr:hypothetical protein [Nitrospinota bacterium]
MTKENFINHGNYRWFWINLLFLILMFILYFLDEPLKGRGGDTPLGYFFGGLATVGILVLMWFGRRKRSYSSTAGTVMGWLSAHVWIGLALIILVPLHSGFQFGWNVHTLAYLLMLATIISGIWGAFNYIQYPSQIMSHRGGDSKKEILGKIQQVTNDVRDLEQDKSDEFIKLVSYINFPFEPGLKTMVFSRTIPDASTDATLAHYITDLPHQERDIAIKTVNLIRTKKKLIDSLRSEIGVDFILKVWLYFHIPLALSLCLALAIHIFSVFYYW